MSGKIRMYNVEFGEAILLYGQSENLLVDLGSINKDFNFDPVRDAIKRESVNKELSVLLTHFHRDHWSGLQMNGSSHRLPSLKYVYLPDIFRMRIPGEIDVIIRSLLGELFDAIILNRSPQFSLADLLREILPTLDLKKIRLLRRGDRFDVGNKHYEVLWPDLDCQSSVTGNSKALSSFLGELDRILAEEGIEEGILETVERMADVLLRDFARQSEYMDTPRFILRTEEEGQYDSLYDQILRIYETLSSTRVLFELNFQKKMRMYAKMLSKDWNKISLVFHNQMDGSIAEESGILMTGDVPASILTKLITRNFGQPFVHDSYTVIKAPHHGTNSHFCPILPNCTYLLISNGSGNSAYQKISQLYEYEYGYFGKKALIYCTNPRCQCSVPICKTSCSNFYCEVVW